MKKSFTLIEILVVTTIIVLLTAMAAISYSVFLKQSRDSRRQTDLEQLRAALEMYRSNSDSNSYPTTAEGLSTLTTTYIQTVPSDPKSPTYSYYYSSDTGADYTLGSFLENGGANCAPAPNCNATEGCNYCMGPYGQISL